MRAVVSVLTALLVLSAGCGGGSDGGTAAAASCVTFTGAQSPASGRVVARQAASGSCGARAVEIVVTDVSDLFGAQFTIAFDASKVSYAGASGQGSVLASGGTQVSVQEGSNSPGNVTVGISRIGVNTGVNASGSQVLIRLTFSPLTPGTSSLALTGAALFGSETPPQTKPGLTFSGGTFILQ